MSSWKKVVLPRVTIHQGLFISNKLDITAKLEAFQVPVDSVNFKCKKKLIDNFFINFIGIM